MTQPTIHKSGARALVAAWRKAAKRMRKEVEDSPSHDLRRMINERMEAVEICANELEAQLDKESPQ